MTFLTAIDLNHTVQYALPNELKLLRRMSDLLTSQHNIVLIGAGPGVMAIKMLEGRKNPPHLWVIEIDTIQWIQTHLEAADVDMNVVTYVKGDSKEVGKDWEGAVDLLVVDGDHSFEGAMGDIDAWFPHVPVGGYMFFHDVIEREGGFAGKGFWKPSGVAKAIAKRRDATWKHYDAVETSLAFQKRKARKTKGK